MPIFSINEKNEKFVQEKGEPFRRMHKPINETAFFQDFRSLARQTRGEGVEAFEIVSNVFFFFFSISLPFTFCDRQ